MTNHRPVSHTVASSLNVVAVFAMTALLALSVAAQSGRRAPKSSSPAPAPTPEAAPVETKPDAETKPALSFIVGIDRGTAFSNIPNYLFDTVLSACAGRLDDSPSVRVDIANRDMHRGEAIKRAKAETESNVVWIQLSSDNARSQSGDDLRDVGVEYYVFAHTTGKIITSGRTYQQAYGGGGVIAMPRPGGRASLPYTEQLLKQAARDAAERILSAMSVSGRKVPA
jgi:hypothetical protein